jgi:hypothetical protein
MDILQTDNKPTLKPKIAKEYVSTNLQTEREKVLKHNRKDNFAIK